MMYNTYKCNSEWFPSVEVSSPGILLEFRIDAFNLSYVADKFYLADGRALMNAALGFSAIQQNWNDTVWI